MNSFEQFLTLLQTQMDRPLPYGWYHWLWIGLGIKQYTLRKSTVSVKN